MVPQGWAHSVAQDRPLASAFGAWPQPASVIKSLTGPHTASSLWVIMVNARHSQGGGQCLPAVRPHPRERLSGQPPTGASRRPGGATLPTFLLYDLGRVA